MTKDTSSERPDLDACLDRLNEAREAARDGQPMTLASIADEPWDAVHRPFPPDPTPELLAGAKEATALCVEEAHYAMQAVYEGAKFDTHAKDLQAMGSAPDGHEYFEQHHLDALARFQQLGGQDRAPSVEQIEALAVSKARWALAEAAEATANATPEVALSAEALAANPWNAVYMRVEDAALLGPARETAERLQAESSAAWQVHEYNGDGFLADEAAEACERLDEQANALGQAPSGPPLDAAGVEVGPTTVTQGKSDALDDPMRQQNNPNQKAETMVSHEDFAAVAREVRATRRDHIERDVSGVIGQLAETAGARDTPAYAAFHKAQAALGDQISAEADPEARAALRVERQAQAHLYAADLADRSGGKALSGGQIEVAIDLHKFAEAEREIAGRLRDPEAPDRGPEGPSGPDVGTREQFAIDAAAVGREVLSPSARTVFVVDGPEREGEEAIRPKVADLTQNIGAHLVPTPEGTVLRSGPQHSYTPPEAPTPPAAAIGEGDSAQSEEAAVSERYLAQRKTLDREEGEQAVVLGQTPTTAQQSFANALAAIGKANEKAEGEEREQQEEPKRDEGKGVARGKYAGLAL